MQTVPTPQSICRFAVAQVDITPPVGIYHRMWGAATHDVAAGVHRPLTATAAVLQDAAGTSGMEHLQVIVALDHCVLATAEIDALLDEIEHVAQVPRDSILVTFSHTHAAGLMNSDRVDLPGGDLIPPYLQQVGERVAESVRDAQSRLQEATISYATGRCSLAGNRDLWDESSGQWVCGYNPERAADETVLVARVTDSRQRPLATIVNYACHPTTLSWDNQRISPDFPGAMREVVERATGVPCLFLQGASGDLGPREGFVGDVEVADRNGRQLGYAALSSLESLPPPGTCFAYSGAVVSGATIGTWGHLPLPSDARHRQTHWRVDRVPLDLSYRAGLASAADVERARAQLQQQEEESRAAGDAQRARELRALVERQTRLLARVSGLPAGSSYPLQVLVCRIGDAFLVGVQGEPYNLLQQSLRQRFAPHPVVVMTIINNWGASYLPPSELYDSGIYQESIAVLAAGSLERLIDEISARIATALENE